MISRSFCIQRFPLDPGVKTPVSPAKDWSGVTILNITPDDVEVHSTDDDDAHYLVIAAGFERAMPKLHENNTTYTPKQTAFWLKAAQLGTVILIWT